MAKKKALTVAVGLNFPKDGGGEYRYERGDSISSNVVEQWMLDDGVVVEGDLPSEEVATGGVLAADQVEVVGDDAQAVTFDGDDTEEAS